MLIFVLKFYIDIYLMKFLRPSLVGLAVEAKYSSTWVGVAICIRLLFCWKLGFDPVHHFLGGVEVLFCHKDLTCLFL
jgi:hypothetical protein